MGHRAIVDTEYHKGHRWDKRLFRKQRTLEIIEGYRRSTGRREDRGL
jgi:exosome complex RNA-binding protein Rrp42 (RNase PH superfamily)